MSGTALATKLYIHPPGARTIARERLLARLDEVLHHRFTLISAPAGFGKTTVVSNWVASRKPCVAWLSLDPADSDPARFFTYLIAAWQTVIPDMGKGVMPLLQSAQPPSPVDLVTTLVNELVALPDAAILVLDDYHAVTSPVIDEAMSLFIDHLPPQVHLVMTTREDPPFPLSRWRARGQLVELRAADLRFTPDEASAFLNGMMVLDLSTADIAALEDRTEGWIAGLQLAALSLRGQENTSRFIHDFTGSHRFVMDYLVDEVLRQQSPAVQDFLCRTSMLDQLCGSLCDAVLAIPAGSGQDTLEYLDRANLFLVPLDNTRQWFRYHHLFADLLRQRLRQGPAEDIAVLHRRASTWHEQHGDTTNAIRHALAAGDFSRAGDLIELAWPMVQRTRLEATALGWLKALPDDVFRNRPVLHVAFAGTLLSCGELERVEDHLREAERWVLPGDGMADGQSGQPVVVDTEAFRLLPGSIEIYRSGLSLVQGHVPATMRHARRALELIPGDAHLWQGAAAALLGLAAWTNGDLDAAYDAYAGGMDHLRQADNIADVIGGTLALADIRVTQGQLHRALRLYQQGLDLAAKHGDPPLRGTADMHVGLSDLARERNDLAAAIQHLQRGMDLGEANGFPQHRYRWRVVQARIHVAQGDPEAALALLDDAERVYVSDFYPNVRPVAALRARVLLAQGRIDDALAWVRQRQLGVTDEPDYLREFEHITLARICLATAPGPEVTAFLHRLMQAAEQGDRTGSVIEILVVLALAHQAAGESRLALASLEQALVLAEPEGFVRLIVDDGAPMARLLAAAVAQGIAPGYTRRLLAACGNGEPETPPRPEAAGGLLSQRELEVLRLIVAGCSNREIGERLFLALDTVKGHNRRIFGKLDVESRTAAIARARELGLTGE